jgi:hypothetical protein
MLFSSLMDGIVAAAVASSVDRSTRASMDPLASRTWEVVIVG